MCVQNDFQAYGMFSAFSINNAPILHQDPQMDRNKLPPEPRHVGVPSGASKSISEPMLRLVQTMLLSCSDTNTVSKRTETRFHMSHVTLEFHRVCPK
jgi:hypothetical protein